MMQSLSETTLGACKRVYHILACSKLHRRFYLTYSYFALRHSEIIIISDYSFLLIFCIYIHRNNRNENAYCGGNKNDFTLVQFLSDNRCHFYQNKVLCLLRPSKMKYLPNGEKITYANPSLYSSLLPLRIEKVPYANPTLIFPLLYLR